MFKVIAMTKTMHSDFMVERYLDGTYIGMPLKIRPYLKLVKILCGKGSFVFTDGSTYVGKFKDGQMHGHGVLTLANGETYDGEWKVGRLKQGTRTYSNGRREKGEFKNDSLNGQGTRTFQDGRTYVGEFKNGSLNGQGTITFQDGRTYVGEFKSGSLNGQGTITFQDGRTYVGEFKNGRPNGQGTRTFPDGCTYVGEFKNGRPNGQGTRTFPDGCKLVGKFRDGKMHSGVFIDKNSDKYVGKWPDSKPPTGKEVFIDSDGRIYVGKFKDGKKQGPGTLIFTNSSRLVGEWLDNKINGSVKFFRSSGTLEYEGQCNEDLQRHGHGVYTDTDGGKYVGEFKDGEIYGRGVYTLANGIKYEGVWVKTKRHGPFTITYYGQHIGKIKYDNGKQVNGTGIFEDSDGKLWRKTWKDGKLMQTGTVTMFGNISFQPNSFSKVSDVMIICE